MRKRAGKKEGRGIRAPGRFKDNPIGWNDRFIGILKWDYCNLDTAVAAILENETRSQICATIISKYVDKGVTDWLYKDRRIRGARKKQRLDMAIAGINEAISLYRDSGRQEDALYLSRLAVELAGQLERSKDGNFKAGPDRHL